MVTADDIKLLVRAGEGYNAEFKATIPTKVKDLSEEVCAFANAAGGTLLIGVTDNNKIIGTTINNSKKSAIQNSLSEITPHLNCTLSLIDVEGKTVGVIEVPSGPNKPYVLSGAIYVRIGPNTQKLTTAEQMRDFFQQAGRIYFDEVPCHNFDYTTMTDDDFILNFKAAAHIGTTVSVNQLFRNLKLFNTDGSFKNGAALFFGRHPEKIIEKAIIRCIAFDGIDKRYIVDDKPFGGNLYAQFQQAMLWLRGKLDVRYEIEGQGAGPRKEVWEIPQTVFKEVLINSLAHRDYYDKGAVTTVEVFNDRVEISNPGGLVSAIPESEFGKRSHSRNPLIFGLFARMRLVEQVGSGIGRIKDLMKEAGLPEPLFQKEGFFTVILQKPTNKSGKTTQKTTRKTTQKTTQKTEDRIIEILAANPKASRSEIARELGDLSENGVKYQLNKLKRQGKIERVGPDKGGHWNIIK